jgi:hypothetical protein
MALTISIISLLVSLLTFWLTRMYRGTVKMTRPTIICLLGQNEEDSPKIFIRTLLYSTADNGRYVQDMFIKIRGDHGSQYFNIWAYGDKDIVRGSGLFVNKSGFSSYHHFLLPNEAGKFNFSAGEYVIEIFVEVVNKNPKKLFESKLLLNEQQAEDLINHKAVYFDWVSKTQSYVGHSDIKQILHNRLR